MVLLVLWVRPEVLRVLKVLQVQRRTSALRKDPQNQKDPKPPGTHLKDQQDPQNHGTHLKDRKDLKDLQDRRSRGVPWVPGSCCPRGPVGLLTPGSVQRLMVQMLPNDAAAIARAMAGEEDGFREIVDRHSRAVYQLAYRITGRAEDAEDVVQETFIKAFRQLGTFEARSSVSTWLHRIGANCAIDLVRRRRPFEVAEAGDVLDQRVGTGAPSQTALLESARIQQRIEETMGELSVRERAAFVMRHFQDSSIDDIASALGMNTSAAKHAVFRAVRKMRANLRIFVDGHTND